MPYLLLTFCSFCIFCLFACPFSCTCRSPNSRLFSLKLTCGRVPYCLMKAPAAMARLAPPAVFELFALGSLFQVQLFEQFTESRRYPEPDFERSASPPDCDHFYFLRSLTVFMLSLGVFPSRSRLSPSSISLRAFSRKVKCWASSTLLLISAGWLSGHHHFPFDVAMRQCCCIPFAAATLLPPLSSFFYVC